MHVGIYLDQLPYNSQQCAAFTSHYFIHHFNVLYITILYLQLTKRTLNEEE